MIINVLFTFAQGKLENDNKFILSKAKIKFLYEETGKGEGEPTVVF